MKSRQFLPVLYCVLLFGCKTSQLAVTSTSSPKDAPIVEPAIQIVEPLISIEDSMVSLPIPKIKIKETFSLVAVGDVMMGTNYPNKSYLPANNGQFLWDDSRAFFQEADIAFANLEGTVLDGEGEPKECKNPDACYLFRMPPELLSNFKDCEIDLVSTANNHANDFGPIGRISTQQYLDSLSILHAGSVETPYRIATINGLKVGFIAFSPNKGTLTFYDLAFAESLIKQLKDSTEVVIVSIHGGAEGVQNQHITRAKEFYFGEDRGNIYEFSHRMIESGADVIIGHGPHVPRAIEVYNERLIAYSLGNFCTYGRFNLKGAAGLAPLLKLTIDRKGKFIEGQIVSLRQSYEFGPQIDGSNAASKSIQELSQKDFPENPISIDEEGRITYIQN